ncbi:MAG: hypothetical protein KTR35_17140 [Gammaproteobacteria bacterium]|nr:hypothetical protein [Gammaproteobacteria bacterium]
MTSTSQVLDASISRKHGILFVLAAGFLWSTVGLGIRLIEDAVVWQILFYRSISMSIFLYLVIRIRSEESPFTQLRRTGIPAVIAGLSLVAAYAGGIFALVITFGVCQFMGLSIKVSVSDGTVAMCMGVFQVGAGLILYTLGSRSLPAAELTLLSLAEVLLGPLWVWIFLQETASVNTLIGGAVLLAAIVGNALSGKRRKPPAIIVP